MDKKIIGLTSILFLGIFLLLASIISQGGLFRAFNPRAAQESVPSSDRSLLFAWPLTVNLAEGPSDVKIDIFARNEDDKPVPDKGVVLTSSLGTVTPISNPTDKSGKATFKLTSTAPGIAVVSATVERVKLKQELSIKFE